MFYKGIKHKMKGSNPFYNIIAFPDQKTFDAFQKEHGKQYDIVDVEAVEAKTDLTPIKSDVQALQKDLDELKKSTGG